jgi:hypothetical protein
MPQTLTGLPPPINLHRKSESEGIQHIYLDTFVSVVSIGGRERVEDFIDLSIYLSILSISQS